MTPEQQQKADFLFLQLSSSILSIEAIALAFAQVERSEIDLVLNGSINMAKMQLDELHDVLFPSAPVVLPLPTSPQ